MLQLETKKSPNISLEILESFDLFLSILFILNKTYYKSTSCNKHCYVFVIN